MESIALLGLGAMGTAFAARWRAAGYPLAVWNRSAAKAEALRADGVTVAATPRAAAAGADIIVAMVTDDDASRGVWLGPDGAFAGARQSAVAIDMSTISPALARALAAHAAKSGAKFLDAPVGGGPTAVAAGKLAVFVGGEAAAFEKARPVLAAIAGRVDHLGPAGAGVSWKLINYMMAGAQTAALAEALAMAEKAGVEPARAAELIRNSVVASPLVLAKLPRMVERRFDNPEAILSLVAKDQRYALEFSKSLGANLILQPAIAEIWRRAEEAGFGDMDLAAIVESVARRANGAKGANDD